MMTLRLEKLDRVCLSLVIIIPVICSYLVVHHVTGQKRHILRENDVLAKKLKDLDLADTSLEQLKANLETTRKELRVINDQIPETAEIGTFLKKIDSLMKERKGRNTADVLRCSAENTLCE
jgi:Tfp pilus assembly protein PilO